MKQPHPAGTERGTERVEAFSDGVFAIAITLLILEVRVPHPPGAPSVDLLRELLHLWPSYFALVLSFVMIGIYWANHHYAFKLFEKTNHSLNLLNLLFLLCISFLPFPTAVLGSYMLDHANQTTAAAFYALGLLLPAASWTLMWLYACHGRRLVDRRLESGFLRRLTLKYVGSVVVYSIAVVVSLAAFKLGLALCVGLTLAYLAPPHFPAKVRRQ
ncbi:MAG TPA: TMEM175 family protein [Dongiaceae bacterium]|nr:TMEM175 family protein [Dongiaceae bacterium]